MSNYFYFIYHNEVCRATERPRSTFRLGIGLVLFCIIFLSQKSSAAEWLTGASFQQRLQKKTTVSWSGETLRSAVTGLAQAQRTAILLDRRVNPQQTVTLDVQNEPLESVLKKLGEKLGIGYSVLDSVVYLGPTKDAARIKTLAAMRDEKIKTLSEGQAKKFRVQKAWQWDDFSDPRKLLKLLVEPDKIKIDREPMLAKDVLAGGDLPPLSLADRLTLLLFQYGLTFDPSEDGSKIVLGPIPGEVLLTRLYPGGDDPRAKTLDLRTRFPQAKITLEGDRIRVSALAEEHDRISGKKATSENDIIAGSDADEAAGTVKKSKKESEAEQIALMKRKFTLTVTDQQLDLFLEELARKVNADLDMDRDQIKAAGVKLDQRINFKVDKANINTILSSALKGTNLQFQIKDNKIIIKLKSPAKK